MNIGNCKNCKKVISYNKIPVCEDCQKLFLQKIKEFIKENGIKTAPEINKATGVPIKVINFFIDEGILVEIMNDHDVLINNTRDDTQNSILLVRELKKQLENNNVISQTTSKKTSQYHYINNDRKER